MSGSTPITKRNGKLTMKCPIDEETLVMTERNGVEIDYCPKCRGVWLDRGELDKIIERTAAPQAAAAAAPRPADNRSGHGFGQAQGQQPYRKKKESFLSELFDF